LTGAAGEIVDPPQQVFVTGSNDRNGDRAMTWQALLLADLSA